MSLLATTLDIDVTGTALVSLLGLGLFTVVGYVISKHVKDDEDTRTRVLAIEPRVSALEAKEKP